MLKRYEMATETCAFCPNLCLHACPVSNAEQQSSVSPWAKMSLVQWVREGLVPMNAESTQMFYKCTGCGACQAACNHGVDVPEVLFAARAEARSRGLCATEHERVEPDVSAMETIRQDDSSRPTDTIYWPGCHKSVGDDATVQDTVAVLNHLGLGPVSLGPAVCCGFTEVCNGRPEVGKNEAVNLGYMLGESRQTFAGPGACQAHLEAQGISASSWVPTVLKTLLAEPERILKRIHGKIAVFEGCFHLHTVGMSDPVVGLLSRICDGGVTELRWCGDSSHCCGASGGYAQTNPEGALEAARQILDMVADTGAEIVASVDPECVAHLKEARLSHHPRVVSAMTLLADVLGVHEGNSGKEE